jgi:hypothetical protein
MENTTAADIDLNRRTLYLLGGIAALVAVGVSLAEIVITFLPGGSADAVTPVEWFELYRQHPFMGLRNMGLLNMGLNLLALPTFLTLYAVHRKTDHVTAALAMIFAFAGVVIFFATNRALPMLDLSQKFAEATTAVHQASLMAAGQAMLAVGASHTPGTFPAFFFSDVASIVISFVMLRGEVFSKINAYAGITGFILLLVFEVGVSFLWGLTDGAMLLAMVGGLLSMAWYVMLALRLFRLERTRRRRDAL